MNRQIRPAWLCDTKGRGGQAPLAASAVTTANAGDHRRVDRWRLVKARAQTAAGSLSPRDLWMPGQRPVVYRHWAGGFCVRCLPAWCLRRFCRALADGGRSCRTRGPAFGARTCVLAVPAQVGGGAAAIGQHLVSRQANAAHPAGLGISLFCPVRDRTQLASYGLLAWESPGPRCGPGARSGDVHRRGGGIKRRVLPPISPVSQRFIWPVADLGCARLIWPAGLHVQALPVRSRAPGLPRCVCPPPRLPSPYRGRAHPSVSSRSHDPGACITTGSISGKRSDCLSAIAACHVDNFTFLLCTGCEWYSSR